EHRPGLLVAGVLEHQEREALGRVAWGLERADHHLAHADLVTILEPAVREFRARALTDRDGGPGPGGELLVTRHEVGMEVRLEHPLDLEPACLGLVEVHLDVARWVHHRGLATVTYQVRGMGEAADVELFEVHGDLLPGVDGHRAAQEVYANAEGLESDAPRLDFAGGRCPPTASVTGVHIELEGQLPFAVDRLFVEPHRAGEQARIGSEVPVETDAATAEGVLAGGVVAGEDEAIELVPRCILHRCESTVEPDHEAGGFGFTLRV